MDLTVTLLEWLALNGPLTLGLVAFVCALGVPLPIPVLMIAAGALVRQGHMHLPTAFVFTAGGALIAEMLYYSIGRELGPRARTRAGARFAAVYDAAERRFVRHPGLTVYLTRWLISPIGIPTSLIAGSTRFPLPHFVLGAVSGNVMWITGYTALGFAVGSDWQSVSPVLDRYKVYFAAAALVIGLMLLAWRKWDVVLPGLRRAMSTIAASAAPLGPEDPRDQARPGYGRQRAAPALASPPCSRLPGYQLSHAKSCGTSPATRASSFSSPSPRRLSCSSCPTCSRSISGRCGWPGWTRITRRCPGRTCRA